MSKLTKTLKAAASANKQLKIENLMGASSKAVKSKSDTDMATEMEQPAAKKKALISEVESSGAESDASSVKARPKTSTSPAAAKKPEKEPASSIPLIEEIRNKRVSLYESVAAFRFNKKRVRILSETKEFPENSKGLVYWMSRDQRVQDNWALLYAQKLALKQNLPLHVCFCIVPNYLNAPYRHYYFMIEGLKEVEKELNELNIPFFVMLGKAAEQLPIFVRDNNIGAVICDFSPLRVNLQWLDELKDKLPPNVPFAQVDAHNIVPCWHASDKLEYAARTIRNKINSQLPDYLTEFPPLIRHPVDSTIPRPESSVNWQFIYDSLVCDRTVKPVDWAKPGYTGGIQILEEFIKSRLKFFDVDRNDPNKNALSNLSPWYHFGQISVQRCINEIRKYGPKFSEAVKSYMEEAIVRRELADNFCFYQPNYDNLEGAYDWARKTLEDHAKDKRPALYTLDELDNFKTGDRLWNACQIQMRVEGKLHGYMRMYWAKKILEWTESPKQALEYSIHLNDRYNLDGRDPNGYVGCMWSICGIHDQGWSERSVFGKIRYMNYEGCKRKFDIERYILKYQNKKNLV